MIDVDVVGGWLTAVSANHQQIAYAVGAVALLLGVWVIWRWWRKGEAHSRVGNLAIVLATAFAAEGMWEVARESLGLDPIRSVVLFAMFEVVMVHQGLMARYKMRLDSPRPVRRHLNVIWAVAAASGVVSSLNCDTAAEFLLRLLAPLVAATIFWMDLTADREITDPSKITWRWTPRRIAVRYGLAEAGEHDLVEADQRRRIDKMALLAHRLHNGDLDPRKKAKVVARLAKMSLTATDETLDEVQRRVNRARQAEKLTRPGALDALDAAPAGVLAAVPQQPASADDLLPVAGPGADPLQEPPAVRRGARPADKTTSRRGDAVTPARPVTPAVPRTAGAYRQWLEVWTAMQAEPGAVNKVLAEQHGVAERTITAIRRAGREGLLTADRLRELEQMITSGAGTGQVPQAEFRAPAVPAPAAVESTPAPALDVDEDRGAADRMAENAGWRAGDEIPHQSRERDKALVG